MKKRNTHFKKKYQKAQKLNDFFVYVVNSGAKSQVDLAFRPELSIIKLQKLNIPSSFRLEKTHSTQGPIVSILYGSKLNFKKLSYLEKFQVLGIKIDSLIYSHQTLKETMLYKTTENLCFSLSSGLLNKLIDFAAVSLLQKEINQSKINF